MRTRKRQIMRVHTISNIKLTSCPKNQLVCGQIIMCFVSFDIGIFRVHNLPLIEKTEDKKLTLGFDAIPLEIGSNVFLTSQLQFQSPEDRNFLMNDIIVPTYLKQKKLWEDL